MNTEDYTFGVQYESLAHPDYDREDPESWRTFSMPVESLLEAHELKDQYVNAYANNNNIRNIEVVYTPKIVWSAWSDDYLTQ